MNAPSDRLYQLMPAIYRLRDAKQNYPLRDLLRVIAEQVDLVEADIAQLYENWFVETCEDWVVPYLGDLVGYRPVHEAGEAGALGASADRMRGMVVNVRREVANTVRARRRRGTLALLEDLARDVADWPARAVEFFTLLGVTQSLAHQQPARGRTADLRDADALERLGGPFDTLAHTAELRGPTSAHRAGRYNLPSIGLFVWRLGAYPATLTRARLLEGREGCFTFSFLGNDLPLLTRPRGGQGGAGAGPLDLPAPIRRRALGRQIADYYGPGKSICLYRRPGEPIPAGQIVAASLADWQYRPPAGKVAIDPERGRVVFPQRDTPRNLLVSYHYGACAPIGGGEYDRAPAPANLDHALLRSDHMLDVHGLLRRLRDGGDPLSHELHARISNAFRERLMAYRPGQWLGEALSPQRQAELAELTDALVAELNRLILGPSLYDDMRFPYLADETLARSPEAWQLQQQEPQGAQLARLNRLLLEEVYRDEIATAFRHYTIRSQLRQPGERRPQPINHALRHWSHDRPRSAVIELADSGVYTEQITLELGPGQALELRAADGCRPIVRLLDEEPDLSDELTVIAGPGSRLVLDGLLIAHRGVRVIGAPHALVLRHTTLVPGWDLGHDCSPERGDEPSLRLIDTLLPSDPLFSEYERVGLSQPAQRGCGTRVVVDHSIVGSITVLRDAVRSEPIAIAISDSVLDATSPEIEALSTPDNQIAHALLSIARSTVIGAVLTHAIERAENTIFCGPVGVARSQRGCMRFCYLAPDQPGAPTMKRPARRYGCQPEQAEQAAVPAEFGGDAVALALQRARERVQPCFTSMRYGSPAYCQLAETCPPEIASGADDESEMGVFHDLFQPQRTANLRARLAENTPAGAEAGIVYVN